MDLTSVANVRAYGAVLPADISDADLQALVARASAIVRGYCSRDITSASYSETFSGAGGTVWAPTHYPVTAVASVTVDDRAIPLAGNTSMAGYRFGDSFVVLRGYRFERGAYNCCVSYTAGVAVVPDDVEHAVILTVLAAYRGAERDPAIRSENDSGAMYQASYLPMNIPNEARQILDRSPFVRRF